MWKKYIIKDNFLKKKHLTKISNIKFDTKANEWDIYKHKIYKDGKIERSFQSSSRKKGGLPLSECDIKDIHETYHKYVWNCLKKLNNKKLQYYSFTELNIVSTGKNYVFPIHNDSRDKLLSIVIYLSPKKNEGTWLYEDKTGRNATQMEWKKNRAFIFSRNEETWHSYKSDGINSRVTLVYNLRSDKNPPKQKWNFIAKLLKKIRLKS